MTIETTRRALLAAIPISAIAVAVPATAIANTDRSAWDGAMRAYERAKAEDAAFTPVYERIHEAWRRGQPNMDMIHWDELSALSGNKDYVARSMDVDAAWRLFLKGEGHWWSARDPQAKKARYRAALDSVQAFRDADASHAGRHGMSEADDRWEALGEATSAAQDTLMELPAPDLAALRWKLDQLPEPNGNMPPWSAAFMAQTFADIDRLLPQGR